VIDITAAVISAAVKAVVRNSFIKPSYKHSPRHALRIWNNSPRTLFRHIAGISRGPDKPAALIRTSAKLERRALAQLRDIDRDPPPVVALVNEKYF
jgi:hypothetical protein